MLRTYCTMNFEQPILWQFHITIGFAQWSQTKKNPSQQHGDNIIHVYVTVKFYQNINIKYFAQIKASFEGDLSCGQKNEKEKGCSCKLMHDVHELPKATEIMRTGPGHEILFSIFFFAIRAWKWRRCPSFHHVIRK